VNQHPLTVLATTVNLTWKDIKAAFAQTRKYLVHTCKFGQVIYSPSIPLRVYILDQVNFLGD
jgi:hypothetical protein